MLIFVYFSHKECCYNGKAPLFYTHLLRERIYFFYRMFLERVENRLFSIQSFEQCLFSFTKIGFKLLWKKTLFFIVVSLKLSSKMHLGLAGSDQRNWKHFLRVPKLFHNHSKPSNKHPPHTFVQYKTRRVWETSSKAADFLSNQDPA